MRPGLFHPASIVTGASGAAALGRVKRWVVHRLYDHLARTYGMPEWTTMNYGYAPPPGNMPLAVSVPEDAAERHGLMLYARVVASGQHGGALRGLDVLEVGSGRGGGAAFVASVLAPPRVTGLDVATAAAALASARHGGLPNLAFAEGDAENLAPPDNSFDLVLNVESAHCYASVPRFLVEAARVLRPGGQLLFAGFASRRGGAYDRLAAALEQCPLSLTRLDDITANVVASRRQTPKLRSFIDAAVQEFGPHGAAAAVA